MAKNLLVIDDEDLVVRSLAKFLLKEGYEVSVARSAQEALEKVAAADFDLIISDVRMPDMDGIETIRRIREALARAQKKPVPEIFITGYADIAKYQQAVAMRVAHYLYKPFDNVELLKVIKEALG